MNHSRIRDLNGQDPYQILGVDRTADARAIIRAHRQRIRGAHPDLPTGSEEAAKLLHLAREVLLDPLQRAEYDRLATSGNRTGQPVGSPWDADDVIDGALTSAWSGDDVVDGAMAAPEYPPPEYVPPQHVPPQQVPPQHVPPPQPPPQHVPPQYMRPRPEPSQSPPRRITNNMTMAVIAVFLFLPLGIPAVVNASRVNTLLASGDRSGALRAARNSRTLSRLALVIGILGFTACCLGCLASGVLSSGLNVPGSPSS